MKTFEPQIAEVKKYVGKQIGNFKTTIYSRDQFFGSSAFNDFILNLQLQITKADISFNAPLQFNAVLKAGPIYVSDMFNLYKYGQVRDKMIGNEAALGVIYSGEALYCQQENPNLDYVIPKEGSNLWIDSWVIPKNAENKEHAEEFINFLCRPDIAKMNFEYITYSIPNSAGQALIEDDYMRNSTIAFPDTDQLKNCETFNFLGDENEALYNELWREVKSK